MERAATDQASLKAAAGLAKPGKWSALGASEDGALVWGACAGSGANPYRVTADLRDQGAKCTCPSRKFPCKHALALMWLRAEALAPFPAAETPDWVGDWLGRRRGGGTPRPGAPKDLTAARADETPPPDDPAATARREAAASRRAGNTRATVLDALDALEGWVGDQLRLGLAGFADDAVARCRRIGARLVDGKAAALGAQADELPSRLLALPAGDRARGAAVELARLLLLARAFRECPGDPEFRRAVISAESREALLEDAAVPRVTAVWEVLAERARTRRDGLVSQSTWLLNLSDGEPRFALLLDFFPASAGRRSAAFTTGDRFVGELAFYPARAPLRAVLVRRDAAEGPAPPWPAARPATADALAAPFLAAPWTSEWPVLLPPGRVGLDPTGAAWWRSDDGAATLPLAAEPEPLALGTALNRAAGLWSGSRLELLAADTPWGRLTLG